jgi:adenylate cyclase
MAATGVACPACGIQLRVDAKFCDECGAPVGPATAAEYKQVTVLFADVVHSMDIAAAVGAERLREIMSELLDRTTSVVQRYGGTVNQFTGDGVMAVFGAPISLEDHASRACLAALDIQKQASDLAVGVQRRDGIDLLLRVGLNSGEVIAGEVGSRAHSYTTVGPQVGMAQRMESVAPPGGVMLSQSTARLVEGVAELGDPQHVQIKGADTPIAARTLLSMRARCGPMASRGATFVGRQWESAALTAMLDRSVGGHGCIASVVGPPGIGKSRLVAETSAMAERRGLPVFSTYCESHTSDVPFQAATRMLRSGFGVEGLDAEAARARVRAQVTDVDSADLVLLLDELGIRDPGDELPEIAPEARRRRLTALVNASVLARPTPAAYVIEDAHWIDPTSEALLADFLSVVPRSRSLVLITYRPEYGGALSRSPGAQVIALAPLDDSQITGLVTEFLGSDPSVTELAGRVAARASGNPFFAEEIVRDLADRGVLRGERGAYTCTDAAEVEVPATVQAAIAARIDRLVPQAKLALNAAAVIGLRFDESLLASLIDSAAMGPLIDAELIDQVAFTHRAEYAFRHPLICSVAYRSQLASARADLHRRLANALEARDPQSAAENAALIAEHLEAAGDLAEAFGWHMRAGDWLTFRDIGAGRLSWERARQVADRTALDQPGRDAMRIAPRALLCATAFRRGSAFDEQVFDEVCRLAASADDKISLAIAMSGRVVTCTFAGRSREAMELAYEFVALVEGIGDPMLELTLLPGPTSAILNGGDFAQALRLAQRFIDLADGDPHKCESFVESPLSLALMFRASARMFLGLSGWKDEFSQATDMVREFIPLGEGPVMAWAHCFAVLAGALRPGAAAVRETAEILESARERGDDLGLECARFLHGFVLAQQTEPERGRGLALLGACREAVRQQRSLAGFGALIDIEFAEERARQGDVDHAIDALQSTTESELAAGGVPIYLRAAEALVDALLQRRGPTDVDAAREVVDQFASVQAESGALSYKLLLLRVRALVARACGDEPEYRHYVERYRTMANELGFEGHIAKAEAMT